MRWEERAAKIKIGGIIQANDLAMIRVLGLPLGSQATAAILRALGEHGLNVPAVVQCCGLGEHSNMALTVLRMHLERALQVIKAVGAKVGTPTVEAIPEVGMVAVFGPHFRDRPAIAGTMFSALAAAGLELLAITTSISTVACIVAASDVARAVAVLEETFLLP